MSKADSLRQIVEKLFAVKPAPRKAAPAKPLALPAPPKQLALPAPGPGLPSYAAKPRGGQFWIDKEIADGNNSPENAARAASLNLALSGLRPEREGVVAATAPSTTTASEWLERALAKYYKTDFGSPDDPLRGLAERGLHYDPEMTPEKWQSTVNSYLLEDPIESVLFPPNRAGGMPGAGSNFRGEVMVAMPWLAKAPVTDKIYGISGGGLDLAHFTDEFYNALNPELSGLPMDLAVRPESLGRMTFPQAVERVGRINQFRAKEMERAALSNLDSPAVRTFKEYPENNPMALRWTELRAPSEESGLFKIVPAEEQGVPFHFVEDIATGKRTPIGGTREDALRQAQQMYGRDPLQAALKYEGDTMGHCVGGYCNDVMRGRSRIFSLRDAKGEPHVTIETSPITLQNAAAIDKEIGDLYSEYYNVADPDDASLDADFEKWVSTTAPDVYQRFVEQGPKERIVQIKGKQNRAPKDDYLPFVQDFVKSGRWGNVGDLGNTGLVKLPDGRYITKNQYDEVIARLTADTPDIDAFAAKLHDWDAMRPYYEGYAVGGRVSADRCFSRNPMSVNKARGGLAVKRGKK